MIRAQTKRLVRSRYANRCGYCYISETEAGAELTYDHFLPISQGGGDNADNLVYACHACNEFKGDYYSETDDARLLHPLQDDLTVHLRYEISGRVESLTEAGERYIRVSQLNRTPLILRRRNERIAEETAERYNRIELRLDAIFDRIRAIEEKIRTRRR